VGNRLGLAALLGPHAWVCSWGVEEGHDGLPELGCHFHEPLGLAVPLGVRHAEAAVLPLFGVAALLMPDHHDGAIVVAKAPPLKLGEPAHDGSVIPELAVAMQLNEPVGPGIDVVERVGPLRVAGNLDALPPGEVVIDGGAQLLDPRLKRVDLIGEIFLSFFVELPHLRELVLQLYKRLFEIK
jgi:hypothetical protein